jgi:hypothetical protein
MGTQSGFENIDFSQIPTDGDQEIPSEDFSGDFIDLAQLGFLSTTVNYCGHEFGLKTLSHEEEVAAAKLVKLAEDSMAQFQVTVGSVVAASITHINGAPWVPNVTSAPTEAWLADRYKRLSKFTTPLIQFLFNELAKLNQRRDKELGELQKKFSGDIDSSTDSVEDSTDRAFSATAT